MDRSLNRCLLNMKSMGQGRGNQVQVNSKSHSLIPDESTRKKFGVAGFSTMIMTCNCIYRTAITLHALRTGLLQNLLQWAIPGDLQRGQYPLRNSLRRRLQYETARSNEPRDEAGAPQVHVYGIWILKEATVVASSTMIGCCY